MHTPERLNQTLWEASVLPGDAGDPQHAAHVINLCSETTPILSLQCRHNCRCLAWITVSHDWAICKILCVYWLLYWIIYWIIIRLSIVHLMLIYHLLYMKWQTTVAEMMRDKGSWGAPTFPVHCTVVDIYVTLRIPLVGHARTKLSFFLIFICLFIYLAVLGIDWGTEDLHCSTQASLVAPCRLL